MKRAIWVTVACLLGGLMVVVFAGGLQGLAQAEGATSAANAGDVVINEVVYDPTGTPDGAHEWLELYNTTDSPITITGWVISDSYASDVIPAAVISARDFLIIAGGSGFVADYPGYSGSVIELGSYIGNQLNNDGDRVELWEGSVLIDALSYGEDSTHFALPDVDAGHSLERSPLGADTGTAEDWIDQPSPTPGLGILPPPGTADLVVVKTGPVTADRSSVITYHVTISNAGAITATGTRLTDTLPLAVTFITQSSTFSFDRSEGELAWYLDDVLTGTVYPITITVQVTDTASGAFTNHITATTTASETVTGNNADAWETAVAVSGTVRVLISALHYYGYDGADDEAARVINVGTAQAHLDGWYLADEPTAGSGAGFPAGVTLEVDESTWCAKSAVAFEEEFGFKPDYETDDTDPAVPELIGSWPGFSNDGDESALFQDDGRLMDVLVYGDSTSQVGWSGAAVQPWRPTTTFPKDGQILYRKPDQATGLPVADTNTAADWAQDPSDGIDGRKVQYPGWDLDEFFQTARVTETANLTVAIAPDNAYEVIKPIIDGAETGIQIEGYTFENAHLIDAVVSRAQAGVTVTVLLEGGEVTDQERWFCRQLYDAGGAAYFMHNDDGADIHDRYRNQHAKFIIVDGQTLIVGSENFNYSALPVDDKANGTWGRRGAFLITDAPGVVARARTIFERDLDTAHKDIVMWSAAHPRYGDPTPGFAPVYVYSDWVTSTVYFSQPLVLTDTLFAFEIVQSPENSLRDSDGLLGLVGRAGAGDVVLVEQLYEYEHWGATASTPAADPNPRLEAYIDAARRGASVHILLNGSWDSGSVAENAATREYVNAIAHAESLDLEAQLGDPAGRGIHNKMVLVWIAGEGGYAHVGSVNGSEASNKINRELALQVKSDAVYDYLASVFEVDWNLAHPVFLPLVMANYTPPPPPADYVVISEVMYRPSGQSTGNREWVELYNPTGQAIDISGWYLGDANGQEYGAGRYRFPSGTVLPAHGVVVVAQQAEDFQGVSGFSKPHFEFLIDPGRDDPTVPNMIADGGWDGFGFALGDGGDKVILRDAGAQDVDAVVYGAASYQGVIPHPGGVESGWSLERRPPYYDTDDCSVDFVPRLPATPGSVAE
ncbi:MAG: lamin tail domain-containing protein [Anaerolineae bacterium]|nr:lamin tail domain-containing protein [Anaerolineae bacterium]